MKGYTNDLRGKRFGGYLVLNDEPFYKNYPKSYETSWRVQCIKCKRIFERTTQELKINSGGCRQCCNIHSNQGINRAFQAYLFRSKQIDKNFEITFSEFAEITKKPCHYCGMLDKRFHNKSSPTKRTMEYYHNGLDRIDNNQGYIIKNVVSCCKICNRAKHTLSQDEFIEYLNNLTRFRFPLLPPDIGESLK